MAFAFLRSLQTALEVGVEMRFQSGPSRDMWTMPFMRKSWFELYCRCSGKGWRRVIKKIMYKGIEDEEESSRFCVHNVIIYVLQINMTC